MIEDRWLTMDLVMVMYGDIGHHVEDIGKGVCHLFPDVPIFLEIEGVPQEERDGERKLVEDRKCRFQRLCLNRSELRGNQMAYRRMPGASSAHLKQQETLRQRHLATRSAPWGHPVQSVGIGRDLQGEVFGTFQNPIPSTSSMGHPGESFLGDEL